MKSKTIKVDYLARVEGEGSLYVKIKDDQVKDVKFKIFESPRFFEAFLRGRKYSEAPDITARICGICPIAYSMSAAHAMEDIFGLKINGSIRELRRLIYCGEWIQSHVLHIYMLHAPDFLGYESAVHMAPDFPDVVKKALEMKKIGNELMELVGGRAVHPINNKVGGFYKVPTKKEMLKMMDKLKWGVEASAEMIKLVTSFNFPEFEKEYKYVCLRHPDEYPFNEGRLVSSWGLDIDISEFEQQFEEIHVEHSNALHGVHREKGAYFVGPLARFNLNYEQLTHLCKKICKQIKFEPICNNPFKSIIARAVETLYAFEEAIRIIENYKDTDEPSISYNVVAGTGYGCTEAPRGICWHTYTVDENGIIENARIVPPTSQNQKTIEDDLYWYVDKFKDLPEDELTWQCEQAIRNYDPCISCATHFLNLEIERE
jgi:coenzyme F420-reducing hydrogenase alpha subunit